MPLSIRSSSVEDLARTVSARCGYTMTDTIERALEIMERQLDGNEGYCAARLTEIASACSSLPDVDSRSADQILGYADNGTFDHGR